MVDLGVDLVWFIVMFAVVLQTSFITPPVGFALFYMKGVAPQGITIQGEIYEQFNGDIDKAMKFYNNLLESYPMSMLAEPVRIRMRQLKNVVES